MPIIFSDIFDNVVSSFCLAPLMTDLDLLKNHKIVTARRSGDDIDLIVTSLMFRSIMSGHQQESVQSFCWLLWHFVAIYVAVYVSG